MKFTVYILYSTSIEKYYVGQTQDIEERLILHNSGIFKGSSTKAGIPWDIFYIIACNSRPQALKIEEHIKRMKSVKYFQSLNAYPEISEKLKENIVNQRVAVPIAIGTSPASGATEKALTSRLM
jgi:putative endonuclease